MSQVLASEVEAQLEKVRSVQESVKHDDGLPASLTEQLSEASMLLNSLPRELQERSKYLESNQAYRLEHQALKEKLAAWVRDAERKMNVGHEGVDFVNIITDLEEHKVSVNIYFLFLFSSCKPSMDCDFVHRICQPYTQIYSFL